MLYEIAPDEGRHSDEDAEELMPQKSIEQLQAMLRKVAADLASAERDLKRSRGQAREFEKQKVENQQ